MSGCRLKIEGDGGTAHGYRLLLDGTDISNVTVGVTLQMQVGQPNKAILTVNCKEIEIGADVEPTLLQVEGPERTSPASQYREWAETGAFVVWKGHRGHEENVAVCLTKERAEKVLTENGVLLRHSPGSEFTDPGAREELLDEEMTPWGIQEIPVVGVDHV